MTIEITNQVRIQQYEDFWYTVEDTHLDAGCEGCTISYWFKNEGSRYAYIGYFSQGSPHPDRGINITHGDIPPGLQGQVWMPDVVKDYVEYIKSKYDEDSKAANELLKPTTRMYNSSNTVKELMGE